MANKQADVKLSEQVKKHEGVVGSAAEYAAYYNYGTRHQDAHPFLTFAGEVVAAKMTGIVSAQQQKEMKKNIAASFDKQIAEGVEIIKYGDPM